MNILSIKNWLCKKELIARVSQEMEAMVKMSIVYERMIGNFE